MTDIESGEPLLNSVEQDQVKKENCILKRCGCIMTSLNGLIILSLIMCVVLGLLKINGKL
jgi:lipopolysaccharide/colanic/teichoic acid biosynthesis glycosyltransferase